MPKIKKTIFLIIFLVAIFIVSSLIWYLPTAFKGYSVQDVKENGVLARNLYQVNYFGMENEMNVILAPSLASDQAEPSITGSRLTPFVLAQIFKLTGLLQYENLIFITIFILALALVFFALAVYWLFGFRIAAVFALIYALFPANWFFTVYGFGEYEVAILFFAIAVCFAVWGLKHPSRYNYFFFVAAGVFLALSGMAREAFFVISPALFLFLLFKRKLKYLLIFFIPFFIIISIFWLPSFFSGQNSYRDYFSGGLKDQQTEFVNWGYFSHIFPDPYTYHFDKNDYLEDIAKTLSANDTEFLNKIGIAKVTRNMGVANLNLFSRLGVGTALFFRQLFRFVSLEEFGGPLVFLLFLLGIYKIKKYSRLVYQFIIVWFVFTFLFISYILLGVHSHLTDLSFIIVLAIALGLFWLGEMLANRLGPSPRMKNLLILFLIIAVAYDFILASHVVLSRIYDQPHQLKLLAYAAEINKLNIGDEEVIAVNVSQYQINKLNYLTGKSMVIFAPETIEKLIKENKLDFAFAKYNVKYIIGYSPELSAKIIEKTGVKNITDDSLRAESPEISKTKSWLMNVIK